MYITTERRRLRLPLSIGIAQDTVRRGALVNPPLAREKSRVPRDRMHALGGQ